MITVKMPVSVGRFMYSVIEHFLNNASLGTFMPRLTPKQRAELVEFFDALAFEISTAGAK
jgi:hypothetical protein